MRRAGAAVLLALLAFAFAALGVWQIERRAWKLRLIDIVDARAHAAPVTAPMAVDAEQDAYRRVRVTGRFVGSDTLVQAVTVLGPGFWALTPLTTREGWTVLVNRGFVPDDRRTDRRTDRPTNMTTVTGLLRISEPGGGFLRANDPAAGSWYSRDVAAIARARGLAKVAPYFIDADAGTGDYPVGGMTVIGFRNNHLIYALTWFALAAMSGYGLWRVLRER